MAKSLELEATPFVTSGQKRPRGILAWLWIILAFTRLFLPSLVYVIFGIFVTGCDNKILFSLDGVDVCYDVMNRLLSSVVGIMQWERKRKETLPKGIVVNLGRCRVLFGTTGLLESEWWGKWHTQVGRHSKKMSKSLQGARRYWHRAFLIRKTSPAALASPSSITKKLTTDGGKQVLGRTCTHRYPLISTWDEGRGRSRL